MFHKESKIISGYVKRSLLHKDGKYVIGEEKK